mmetsp:Transcript_16861/g.25504  ORF Transcript_16861/g.25504 Transcript_16861/m.25504 type:complete len:228 (+) Transcript_16861:203-886(+)|eukprot:CAMPEP_0178919820 /NCGR_PEP_ID=MMETSP0786-20121207/14652_1 /TAXON_ID=186022 /ORGANISM="Thalassionema frauenfeldii, Strain CCMP 1798" /LENGTH=227 /DNA_ID=CAMNT_0020593799 /DNA_START=142 /DNA_END=825 /DNA_ORIENTATION=-
MDSSSRISTNDAIVATDSDETPEKKALHVNNYDYSSPSAPKRVLSSSSLFGEDIAHSGQCFEDCHDLFDSYSEDDHTTPPSTASLRQLSPPPLRPYSNESCFDLSPSNSASKKFVGRPPIPHVPVRNGFISIPSTSSLHHRRSQSVGELSVTSALTDKSDEELCKRTNRSSSWEDNFLDLRISAEDFEFVLGSQGGNEAILQPILDEEPPRLIQTLKEYDSHQSRRY